MSFYSNAIKMITVCLTSRLFMNSNSKMKHHLNYYVMRLVMKTFHLGLVGIMAPLVSLTSLFLNLLQLINYCLFFHINKNIYRFNNFYLQDLLLSQSTTVCDWYLETKIRVFFPNKKIEEMFGKEHSLVIGNHTYQIDSIFYWMMSKMFDILGSVKACAKNDLRWMPVFGWTFYFGEYIFLKRNWKDDQKSIGPSLDTLMSYNYPVSLLLLPEGTRFTKQKHLMSQKFAKERNISHNYKHHLLPRTKGFLYMVQYLRSKYEGKFAIYNVEITQRFEGKAPEANMINLLRGKVFHADIYLERYDSTDFPAQDAPEQEWEEFLYKMFDKKDQLVEDHKRYSVFPKSYIRKNTPSVADLIKFVFLNAVVSGGFLLYLIYTALTTHSFVLRCTIYGLFIIAFLGLSLVLVLTQNSKYGTKLSKQSKPNVREHNAELSASPSARTVN